MLVLNFVSTKVEDQDKLHSSCARSIIKNSGISCTPSIDQLRRFVRSVDRSTQVFRALGRSINSGVSCARSIDQLRRFVRSVDRSTQAFRALGRSINSGVSCAPSINQLRGKAIKQFALQNTQ